MFFDKYWREDITSMVLRDRNHPSVVMWSTGNELFERRGRSNGYALARETADFIRNLDSTRPITNALQKFGEDDHLWGLFEPVTDDVWGDITKKFCEPLDVTGYNYLPDRLEPDGRKYPERVIAATETFPRSAFDGWEIVERCPHVIGDFVWTALDYLGEAGIGHVLYDCEKTFFGGYPWHQAFCGDIDICGFRRPQSYYRDFVWGNENVPYIAVYKPENHGKTPVISDWGWSDVINSWSFPGFEGKPVKIDVYSCGSEVELSLNGKSLGKKPAGKENKYIAKFETQYEPGELIAVTYENGEEKCRSSLKSASVPVSIRLTPDRVNIDASYGDLSFVTVELVDKDGNIVHYANNNIYFSGSGAGSLIAVGSGNPKSEEMYTGSLRRVHEGRAMVVVRANGEPGKIVLRAASEGIPAAETVINAKAKEREEQK